VPSCYGSTLSSNSDHPLKIINERHKQRSGQQTLARQKNIVHKKGFNRHGCPMLLFTMHIIFFLCNRYSTTHSYPHSQSQHKIRRDPSSLHLRYEGGLMCPGSIFEFGYDLQKHRRSPALGMQVALVHGYTLFPTYRYWKQTRSSELTPTFQ
jgi:hypothetical protein